MKFIQLRSFEKHLVGTDLNHFSAVYFIIGKESFERKIALDALLKRLLPNEQERACALQSHDAGQLTPGKLADELYGMTLFLKKQVIVLHYEDKLDKDLMHVLEGYFSNPNPSVYLVISAAAINKNTNFYKKGEKVGIVLDLVEEKPKEKEASIAMWMHACVANGGKRIDPAAGQRLIKLVGPTQSALHGELEKLMCYIGDRPQITLDDISKTVTPLNVENGWHLAEALFCRDVAAGLRISKALLLDGVVFFVLLRLLRTQFQTEFHICSILERGGGASEISQLFPYMKGHVLDKHMEMALSYGFKRFKQALLKIDETELEAKNSSLDPDLLMERLVIKLAT